MAHEPDQSRDRQGASGVRWRDASARTGPLAYFLTFTCHGTWLHGDDRGSIDRQHNSWGSERVAGARERKEYVERFRMESPQVKLDAERRGCVDGAIRYACARRIWVLHALNVRTNHLHAVVSGSDPPEAMLTSLKAWATRRLAESGLIERGVKVWTRGDSTRYLWTTDDVAAASWYVLDGQGSGLGSAAAVEKSAARRSLPVAAQVDHPGHGRES